MRISIIGIALCYFITIKVVLRSIITYYWVVNNKLVLVITVVRSVSCLTLTYNPNIGLNFVYKSETWTTELSGKNSFDFESFKINYRGIHILLSIELLWMKIGFFDSPTAL